MLNFIKNFILFFLSIGLAVAGFIFSGKADETISYYGIAAGFASIAVFIFFINRVFKVKKEEVPGRPKGVGNTEKNEADSGESGENPAENSLPEVNENKKDEL